MHMWRATRVKLATWHRGGTTVALRGSHVGEDGVVLGAQGSPANGGELPSGEGTRTTRRSR